MKKILRLFCLDNLDSDSVVERASTQSGEFQSLKDCDDGTWLHGEGDVTKLDSGCDADGYAEILTSAKYRLIVDAILFEGHLWLVVDSKERDLHVVRFANGQEDLEDIDEAE